MSTHSTPIKFDLTPLTKLLVPESLYDRLPEIHGTWDVKEGRMTLYPVKPEGATEYFYTTLTVELAIQRPLEARAYILSYLKMINCMGIAHDYPRLPIFYAIMHGNIQDPITSKLLNAQTLLSAVLDGDLDGSVLACQIQVLLLGSSAPISIENVNVPVNQENPTYDVWYRGKSAQVSWNEINTTWIPYLDSDTVHCPEGLYHAAIKEVEAVRITLSEFINDLIKTALGITPETADEQ